MAIIMNILIKPLLTFLFLFSVSNVIAATFSAQLNVNPVILSDSFQLTYTAEGSIDDEPDFSPIKKDFDLIGTSQSSNVTMINGDFKRNKKWTLSLRAKNSGTFIIPAISFGNEQAPEVEIIVKNVSTSNVINSTADFLVELEASAKNIFVQEQVIVTARLLIAQNINSYQFSELHVDDSDTIIETLGKDKQYKTYRGSKPYIIIERQFAIFPQHPGKLHIDPFVTDIGILRRNSRGNIFDPFNSNTSTKRIQSNSIDLSIKSKPSSFKGKDWLPTPSLKLIENWPANTSFFVGEPITRTITLMVDGLVSSQLPEVNQQSVHNIKQYPDKPITHDNKTAKGFSSTLKQKIALIPTQPGTYTLPAIDIPWWNTRTNKIDIAHISKRDFTVLASPRSTTNQQIVTQPPENNQQPLTTAPVLTDSTNTIAENINPAKSVSNPVWLWLSSLFFILWVITILLWWRSRRSNTQNISRTEERKQSLTSSLKYLKIACSKNNPQEIKSSLLRWSGILFPDKEINNLSDLATVLGEPISKKILSLNAALYRSSQAEWQCEELYKLCHDFKLDKNRDENKKNTAELEAFNKD